MPSIVVLKWQNLGAAVQKAERPHNFWKMYNLLVVSNFNQSFIELERDKHRSKVKDQQRISSYNLLFVFWQRQPASWFHCHSLKSWKLLWITKKLSWKLSDFTSCRHHKISWSGTSGGICSTESEDYCIKLHEATYSSLQQSHIVASWNRVPSNINIT